MHFLGIDLGSSSVKLALIEADSGQTLVTAKYPDEEMPIKSPQKNFAEQDPDFWWFCVVEGIKRIKSSLEGSLHLAGIGIAYQMHGLVLVDDEGKPLRDAIIWCDGRAVESGDALGEKLGASYCFDHLLNLPGNFTASKLKWVRDHEVELFSKASHFMLPGDYIAYKLTNRITTTIGGLSEGTLWDFKSKTPSSDMLSSISAHNLLPELVSQVGYQAHVSNEIFNESELLHKASIFYRAGDQPNNAASLGVFELGEVAATAGTSGVLYAITDQPIADKKERVNVFSHVNYTKANESTGVLLCINACGILYAWLRRNLGDQNLSYDEIENKMGQINIGSDGLLVLPFGNGPERMLNNQDNSASILNLDFNRHSQMHLYRAGIEAIACAFAYGAEVFKELEIDVKTIKAGSDNLFQSAIFSQMVANLLDAEIQIVNSSGAEGAALMAAVGAGKLNLSDINETRELIIIYRPNEQKDAHFKVYANWKEQLNKILKQ